MGKRGTITQRGRVDHEKRAEQRAAQPVVLGAVGILSYTTRTVTLNSHLEEFLWEYRFPTNGELILPRLYIGLMPEDAAVRCNIYANGQFFGSIPLHAGDNELTRRADVSRNDLVTLKLQAEEGNGGIILRDVSVMGGFKARDE